ncbi:8-amino-7-oxononanoate synthase [Erwinia sp. CPCC 100877]|nr:8-amino-7-oxononanoate synthase [Erwinia sp. CPCC 100877]
MSWSQRIGAALAERRAADSFRVRQPLTCGNGRLLQMGQRLWRNFSCNDYLGLSRHPQIIAAWQDGAARYGVGSGGSGHVTGYSEAHEALEQALAVWLGYPRALLFISGFAANQAVIHALARKEDRLVADRLSHASLLEAASLSLAQLRRFPHNNTAALGRLLAAPCGGQQLVITEGVFSMDGDRAPLTQVSAITRAAGGWLMVDDAHGIGVTGEQGRGSCHQAGIRPELLVVTFGKAFGVSGAAVLCSEPLADYLLQFARHLVYSTAMPPAQARALSASLEVIRSAQGDALRQHLQSLIARFRIGAAQLPLQLAASETAIQPLIVGDNARALRLAQHLRERGFWCCAIRPPTVPAGTARLRLTLSAAHQVEDIDALLEALYDCRE